MSITNFVQKINVMNYKILIAFVILFVSCSSNQKNNEMKKMNIILKSNAFLEAEMIPQRFTCDNQNISPQLSWSGQPAETKSFAIICSDPDAPSGDFVHWVIYNIHVSVTQLSESIRPTEKLADGTLQGLNSSGRIGYMGPCTPSGVHRYYFHIYALDTSITDYQLNKVSLLAKMKGHILAEGELMGRYTRMKK